MSEANPVPLAPRRKRWRLRGLAWSVLLTVTLLATVIIVPGVRPLNGPQLLQDPVCTVRNASGREVQVGPPQHVIEYEHGWPLTFLRRAKGYTANSPRSWRQMPRIPLSGTVTAQAVDDTLEGRGLSWNGDTVAWTRLSAWQLTDSDASEWSAGALFADGLLAIVLVAVATAGTEYWIRKRGSIWRWRMIDLLAVTAVAAAALAWWSTVFDSAGRSAAASLRVSDKGATFQATVQIVFDCDGDVVSAYDFLHSTSPQPPALLARLLGNHRLADLYRTRVELAAANIAQSGSAGRVTVGPMQRTGVFTEFDVNGPTADCGALSQIENLQSLVWVDPQPTSVSTILEFAEVPRFRPIGGQISTDDVMILQEQMAGSRINVRRRELNKGRDD